jgi:hypothetical protein
MCYFVFVGLPGAHQLALATRLTKAGCQLASTDNAGIRAAFPKGDVVSVVTRGGCSCDLYAERRFGFDEEAERAKYRKKKWSAAKIDRAIFAKRPQERPAFAAFREAFAAIAREAGGARIMTHSFSGSVETEDVQVTKTITLTLDDYLHAGGSFVADVLHRIRIC